SPQNLGRSKTAHKHGHPASVLTDNGKQPSGLPSTQLASLEAEGAGTASKHFSSNSTSNKNTPDPATPPPPEKSNASIKASNAG
ncbi:MAG: hypothetical protein KDB24_05345, partial [Microthrixaceae bacterium]|nr:hypothetical protein [Microthrixaceae bacterium]